jgi:hypothetical protein
LPPKNRKPEDERQIIAVDGWAVTTDGHQWILQRLRGEQWAGVSFVHSTRDILARCLAEKGVPPETAKQLLAAVGKTFDQKQNRSQRPLEVYGRRSPPNSIPKAGNATVCTSLSS